MSDGEMKINETADGRERIEQTITRLREWCLAREIPWTPKKKNE